MKLPQAKFEKAAGLKDIRPSLQNPYLDCEAGRIYASNGHYIVSLPAEDIESDTSGVLPVDAIKAARKSKTANISANGSVDVGGISFPRKEEKYPDVTSILKRPENLTAPVKINAKYLALVAAAMAEKNPVVTLEFDSEGTRFFITPEHGDAIAVVMGIRERK
tara:strand:- start:76 stop:564 length:489 start_codon:yes stop_codon:yes gene_type:complete